MSPKVAERISQFKEVDTRKWNQTNLALLLVKTILIQQPHMHAYIWILQDEINQTCL